MSARSHSTTSSLSKKLTYTMGRHFQNGAYQHFFTARCNKCNRSEEVAWSAGSEPDRIAKKMQEMGWSYDAFKSRACICPECKGGRASPAVAGAAPHKRGRPRPLHIVEETRARRLASTAAIEDGQEAVAYTLKDIADYLGPTIRKEEPVAQVLTMTTTPPPLTIAAKARVRKLLDENFDDEHGRYTHNYSDQRIGEEVGVPWAAVAAMREAAYGPLRADPRLDKLGQDFIDIKAKIASLETRVLGDIDVLNKRLQAAEKLLTDINTGG